jgi:hypothetical protein
MAPPLFEQKTKAQISEAGIIPQNLFVVQTHQTRSPHQLHRQQIQTRWLRWLRVQLLCLLLWLVRVSLPQWLPALWRGQKPGSTAPPNSSPGF